MESIPLTKESLRSTLTMVIVAVILFSGIASAGITIEDFTTYTENDPNNTLTVDSATQVSFAGVESSTDTSLHTGFEQTDVYTVNYSIDIDDSSDVGSSRSLLVGGLSTGTYEQNGGLGNYVGVTAAYDSVDDFQIFRLATDSGTSSGICCQSIDESSYIVMNVYTSNDTATVTVYDTPNRNTKVGSESISITSNSYDNIHAVASRPGIDNDGMDGNVQNLGFSVESQQITGTVTDTNNNIVSGATVEASQSGTVVESNTTDGVGEYTLTLTDGTYNITASKQGYINDTEQITVSDSGVNGVDLTLRELNQSIELNTRSYIKHGESADYTVVIENDTGRYNVSQSANVTSSDTDVITVNSQQLQLDATNNISINRRVAVTADYTDAQGNTYTTSTNVTVANLTVENTDILPTSARVGASVDDTTIQAILVATILGVAATLLARSFAGLATMTLVMTLAWFGDMVGNGMLVVTILIALFIGLNIATNIDYSVIQQR